jgi:hypothetical protein
MIYYCPNHKDFPITMKLVLKDGRFIFLQCSQCNDIRIEHFGDLLDEWKEIHKEDSE